MRLAKDRRRVTVTGTKMRNELGERKEQGETQRLRQEAERAKREEAMAVKLERLTRHSPQCFSSWRSQGVAKA